MPTHFVGTGNWVELRPCVLSMRSLFRLCSTFPVVIIVMMVRVMMHWRGHQHKHHHHHQLAGCSALRRADFSYLGEGVEKLAHLLEPALRSRAVQRSDRGMFSTVACFHTVVGV